MIHVRSTYPVAPHKTLEPEQSCLSDAALHPWHFCHHPALGVFRGRLYAMWSNGREGEDEIGQRVLYAVSADGKSWSAPKALCEAFYGVKGINTLTAAGFHVYDGVLTAYVGAYEYACMERLTDSHGFSRVGSQCVDTRLYALTSTDGETFSPPRDLGVALCPNYGPRKLKDGRLLMTGNWAHAYTDDPAGLRGWTLRGFCSDPSPLEEPVRDDPGYFWKVSSAMGFPNALCEGAFLEADGRIHMLHRSYGSILYESDSTDGGETWSVPEPTEIPNGNAKFWLGTLPDGRYIYIGNPGPGTSRCPLALSLAGEDMVFDTHALIESRPISRKFPGMYKGGMYGYPHAVVYEDGLYVIYSVWKEDIRIARVPLAAL